MNNPIYERVMSDKILTSMKQIVGKEVKQIYYDREDHPAGYDKDLVVIEFSDGTYIFINSVMEYDCSWLAVETNVNKYYAAGVGLYDKQLLQQEVTDYQELQQKTRLLTKEKENKEILDKLAHNPELLKMAKSRFNF